MDDFLQSQSTIAIYVILYDCCCVASNIFTIRLKCEDNSNIYTKSYAFMYSTFSDYRQSIRLNLSNLYEKTKCFFFLLQDPTKEFLRKVGIGFTSGTIASIANIPIDVAKSRIQVSYHTLHIDFNAVFFSTFFFFRLNLNVMFIFPKI